MADVRTWPALLIEAPDIDTEGEREGRLAALLDDFAPAAIEDLAALPLPPGGLWDSSFPPIPPHRPPAFTGGCSSPPPTRAPSRVTR